VSAYFSQFRPDGTSIYWKNPGDGGLATSVEMALPKGFEPGLLRWPHPATFKLPGDITNYGYTDSVLLWMLITPPKQMTANTAVNISAEVEWLACQQACVPGKARLSLSLATADQVRPTNEDLFSKWASQTDPVAPPFTLRDQDGKPVSLSDFATKIVVLEWLNVECPFVQRHYAPEQMTMPRLFDKYRNKGVVWLAVNSTNPCTAEQDKAFHDAHKLLYPVLDDHLGMVGKTYCERRSKSAPGGGAE